MTAWRVHSATVFYSLLAALPDIDAFLDIGSLDGRESFAVETRFPGIKCIAFEPNPRNIAVIQHEIARRHSHVELKTIALGNENRTVSFYTRAPVSSQNYGASSVLPFAREERNEEFATATIEVALHRLDSLDEIASFQRLALWIDVEGAGYQVLEGMAGIAHTVQLVHIEVETRPQFTGGKLASDVLRIMHSYGFELVGSNLDRNFRRHQGDMVFLRKQSLSQQAKRRAILTAALVEYFAVQRLAKRLLPSPIYRAGREWLVRHVTAR